MRYVHFHVACFRVSWLRTKAAAAASNPAVTTAPSPSSTSTTTPTLLLPLPLLRYCYDYGYHNYCEDVNWDRCVSAVTLCGHCHLCYSRLLGRRNGAWPSSWNMCRPSRRIRMSSDAQAKDRETVNKQEAIGRCLWWQHHQQPVLQSLFVLSVSPTPSHSITAIADFRPRRRCLRLRHQPSTTTANTNTSTSNTIFALINDRASCLLQQRRQQRWFSACRRAYPALRCAGPACGTDSEEQPLNVKISSRAAATSLLLLATAPLLRQRRDCNCV